MAAVYEKRETEATADDVGSSISCDPSPPIAQRLDPQGKRRRRLAAAGVVIAGEWRGAIDPALTSSEIRAQRLRRQTRECELTEINMACPLRCVDTMRSIPREAAMRILALAILAIATIWAAGPVRAQTYGTEYPVCLHAYTIDGDYIECAYTSLAQCAMSASGRAAQCIVNPYFATVREPGEPRYRRHRRVH